MTSEGVDLEFPTCCTCCPYLERVTASCTHELRQSLVRELDSRRTCPVYSRRKTDAMRHLAESMPP